MKPPGEGSKSGEKIVALLTYTEDTRGEDV